MRAVAGFRRRTPRASLLHVERSCGWTGPERRLGWELIEGERLEVAGG
ncbi:hypothetical protein ACFYN3_41565 [Streptomyces lavendulae]